MTAYVNIINHIQQRAGLVINNSKYAELTAFIDDLCETNRMTSADELFAFLIECPTTHPFWQELINEVAIGETYFFRNRPQFEALRNHVLPELIAERRRQGQKQLRIWSVASATGEEPYSIAILLRNLIPDIDQWSISILGTDINDAFLDQARKGLFRKRSFRNETPDKLQEQWFTQVANGYQIDTRIRHMVVFRPLNLVSDHYPSFETGTMHMDLIMCRNVTIYFERETTREVISRLHHALNHEGWLIVGHSEPQSELYDNFTIQNFENTIFYQKAALPSQLPQPYPPKNTAIAPYKPPAPLIVEPKKLQTRKKNVKVHTTESIKDLETLAKAKDFADQGSWDEAHVWLDKLQSVNHLQPHMHYLRGLVACSTGDMDEGLQHMRRAVYLEPDFALAHYALGDLYQRQGAQKNAIRHWRWAKRAVAHNHTHFDILYGDKLTVEILSELIEHRLGQG